MSLFSEEIERCRCAAESPRRQTLRRRNPSFGPLMVQYSFARDARMLIYDVLGREVFSIELSAMVNQIQVSLPEMAPGLYTYFVRTEGNVIHQGKIIFQ